MDKEKVKKILSDYRIVLGIFILFALGASVQAVLEGLSYNPEAGRYYTCYNNYVIFKNSYFHLLHHKDLYKLYLDEQWDLYKYSPTFSMFFGIFAYLPDAMGLSLWNLLNALILLFAVYYLPKLSNYQKGLILITCLIELMTSMQNEQSNGLMVGLLILAFGLLEKEKYGWAVLSIVFTAYVKLFGIVGFSLFLFYPKKWKLALYTVLWIAVLWIIPLLVVDLGQLKFLYESWGNLLLQDHAVSYGLSVMGWLHSWFGISADTWVLAIGSIMFCLPFVKIRAYKNLSFRLLALTSVLLWVVIFNHKAESPTFIIAMAGVCIWFYALRERNILNLVLFITAFVLTSLSPTDIFPAYLRVHLVNPYVLKAFPCILIWGKIIYDMLVFKSSRFGELEV